MFVRGRSSLEAQGVSQCDKLLMSEVRAQTGKYKSRSLPPMGPKSGICLDSQPNILLSLKAIDTQDYSSISPRSHSLLLLLKRLLPNIHTRIYNL
ncbi:hypothetical protein M7I_7213 [Glarea lozoyensis 74030]|uniref:Uncharacterized protein n=1 Tax=Glarea lozoyensis (strain ATCC 74030 / MF5533) TaxID=1104152 RepID=H0EWP1_GLAL7|nr:hypothetical protein M7I_7213 [Glarea lozoyensis 74030]